MAVNSNTARMEIPSRDEIAAKWLRDYSLRNPSASTAEGEEPHTLSLVFADQMMPVYAEARRSGDAATWLNQYGDDLDNTWAPRGIPRNPAKGGSGFVRITAASGGGPIFLNDEAKTQSGLVFACREERLDWQDGDVVPLEGIDTGTGTNLKAGTKLTWSEQRPGIGLECVVVSNFTGGAPREEDDAYKLRIAERQANPEAAGNDADVTGEAEKTPGVSVEKAFTYPCILGSCTTAVVCTLKPTSTNATRVPTEPQRALIEAHVVSQFPKGEIYVFPTAIEQLVSIACDVRWAKSAPGWQDLVPWPPRYAVGAGRIVVSPVTATATSFTLAKDNGGSYTGIPAPQPGNTIAFFDKANNRFSRKKIATVTGTGPWAITCSTDLNASDTSYVPLFTQWVGPWSDSLQALLPGIVSAFATLGPGEMVSSPQLQDGLRQLRYPPSEEEWPSALTSKALNSAFDVPEVATGVWTDGADTAATVGTPGVTCYVISPKWITAYAK